MGCDIVSIRWTPPFEPIFFRLSVIRDIIITFDRKFHERGQKSLPLILTVTLIVM